jgi:Leucine-rich repeat (LRR) protein
MKKLYFLLIALCFLSTAKAQIVTIPDAIFKSKLLVANGSNQIAKDLNGLWFKIDANSDGQIQESEALEVSYLNVNTTRTSDFTGISSFINLTYLDCHYNLLTSLDVSSLKKLIVLRCDSNQLSNLNITGLTNLQELSCFSNRLNILDFTSLNNLTYLNCNNNLITSLNVSGLSNLQELNCNINNLKILNFNGLINLKKLYISQNLFTSFDVSSLTNLQLLACGNNNLKTLNLSDLTNLLSLSCSNAQLESLNLSGLINLKELYCSQNYLTSLNLNSLQKLETLSCYNNNISLLEFDKLTLLKTIGCNNNKLTSLDVSKLMGIKNLHCYDNNLVYLNIKNGQDETNIHFFNNPNLQYVCTDDSQTLQIQNLITQYGYANCTVNNYCSFTPGGTFYTIEGNGKFDWDNDGCDVSDPLLPFLFMKVTDAVGTIISYIVSDITGFYSIDLPAGSFTLTPVLENQNYFIVTPKTFDVTFPTQVSPYKQDFCLSFTNPKSDLEVVLLPLEPARPGFDAKYKIVYKNKGNTTQSGSVNLTFDDAVLDLVVANPVTTTQTTTTLSWDFTDLLPFETREIVVTLNVNSPVETPSVVGGTVLAYVATITSAAIDETPLDNTFAFNQTVVNSFDPNDKTCLEGSIISPSLIGQYVHYMIRFENNGTANAQNIVVKDMIDLSKFDISTLVPTDASHSFVTTISAGNKIEFIFENIHLPFDDANNDGYIAFKIKTLPTLVVNDTFTNDASIYFDYNFPVVTKLASSTFKTLATQDFEFSNYFTLYPNPVQSILNISSKETIEVKSISIYNTLGQLVLVIPNAEKVSKIDVSSLTTGNYFIKINSDKGTSNARFIKE